MSVLLIFDYAELDVETRIVVQQRTTEIKERMRRAAQDIIEIGQRLIEVKARLGHGNFGAWLGVEFDWSERTARQFMTVADQFKSANFADFQIAPSALYLLAAPSTPDPVRIEALHRAEHGEVITHAVAKAIKERHTTSEPDFVAPAADPPPWEQFAAWEAEAAEDEPAAEEAAPVTPDYDRDEWYTPDWLLDLAREVLGTIDLDPASCAAANAIVQARRFYDKAGNGLAQPWSGRIWVNPPYSRGNIEAFVEKLIAEYDNGNLARGLLLVNNATETGWFQSLLARFPVCFLNKRVEFWHAERGGDSPRQGQVVFYVGVDWLKFQKVFSAAGTVISIDNTHRIWRAIDRLKVA